MGTIRRPPCVLVVSTLLVVTLMVTASRTGQPGPTITVSGTPWGPSTCYIGATEGNVRFDIDDLVEAGLTTYRIYGGMSRWEWQDDDGVYGQPTIEAITADPNVINWSWWDAAMTTPPQGSDYWWSGQGNVWQGNARTIFRDLQTAGIRPVLTLRNVDNFGNPAWAQALNPPSSPGDWHEWWAHVFATVYWLNVRNDYRVDDFEVHNEPNSAGQGWGGTLEDYYALIASTRDAIRHVYETYLPGRTFRVYAPVTGGTWPRDAMIHAGEVFDTVDVHNYNADITGYTSQVRGWMAQYGKADAELWLSEWATYRGGYQAASVGVTTVLNNLIRGASPGNTHIDGSHLFTFYDWSGAQPFQGLVGPAGTRLASFYALRMGMRALNGTRHGCKTTYQSTTSQGNLLAITTTEAGGPPSLLVTNSAKNTAYTVDANLSALLTSGTGTAWQFDATHHDILVGQRPLRNGHVTFTVPAMAAILITF
jgi:hypothetical protein